MTEPFEDPARVDEILAASVGRRLLAELASVRFSDLLDALELPYPPNMAKFTSGSDRGKRPRLRAVVGRHIVFDPLHRMARSLNDAVSTHRAAVLGVSPDDATDALRRVLADPEGPSTVDVGDASAVLEAFSHVIRSFGFWGNEMEYDRLLSAAVDDLRPLAEALVASSTTRWWWDDVLRSDQRYAARAPDHETGPPRGDRLAEQVRRAAEGLRTDEEGARRRHRSPGDVPDNASGHWWSIPIPGTWTSRAVAPVPALHLACAEETSEDRAVVWSLRIASAARVFEVRGPSDWGRLVEMAPVDVTMSRLGDWRNWTGKEGPFYLPDWRVVAEHVDGVHVTAAGYLTTRSVPVPVADGFSVLAGWEPDATLWLRDVFEAPARLGEWEGPFRFVTDGGA
jgi:hypothetical protein